MRQLRETYLLPSEPEAIAYAAYVARRYPHEGYGTKTSVRPSNGLEQGPRSELLFAVDVERWNSCD
jgi:hypothetical protein